MLLGKKNQYCENDYITKCNLQIQYNPYQITNGIFHRTRTKKISKFVWRHKSPHIAKLITQLCPTLCDRWSAAGQAAMSIMNSQNLLKLMSIESVMTSNHIILFSCLQSFPASGFFQMSPFFPAGGQSIRVSASASVLPMNIQD